MAKLTPKQQRFVDCYAGNATEAARQAGYQGSDSALGKTGFDLLRNPKVAAAIGQRLKHESATAIADRQARQRFWTETMADTDTDMRARLKASELLARSEGDFLERVEHSGEVKTESEVMREILARVRPSLGPPSAGEAVH